MNFLFEHNPSFSSPYFKGRTGGVKTGCRSWVRYSVQLIYYLFLCLLLSCSADKPADLPKQSAPESSNAAAKKEVTSAQSLIEITPAEASRNETLTVLSKEINLTDAKIVWLINDKAGPEGMRFKTGDVKRGDIIQAKAVFKDREVYSNKAEIKNTRPEISRLKFNSEIARPGDTLSVDVSGTDLDGDPVTFLFDWVKNGQPAGNTRQMGSPVRRGDKISVRVTPFDGQEYGTPLVVDRVIKNSPPVFSDDYKHNFDGKLFTYQVKASDPDDDALTFSLKSAPEGMTINPNTGLVNWNVPLDFHGKASFNASVYDGHGGEATSFFNVDISPFSR